MLRGFIAEPIDPASGALHPFDQKFRLEPDAAAAVIQDIDELGMRAPGAAARAITVSHARSSIAAD